MSEKLTEVYVVDDITVLVKFLINAKCIYIMKTPERSRTSRVKYFLVLSPQNSLCDVT